MATEEQEVTRTGSEPGAAPTRPARPGQGRVLQKENATVTFEIATFQREVKDTTVATSENSQTADGAAQRLPGKGTARDPPAIHSVTIVLVSEREFSPVMRQVPPDGSRDRAVAAPPSAMAAAGAAGLAVGARAPAVPVTVPLARWWLRRPPRQIRVAALAILLLGGGAFASKPVWQPRWVASPRTDVASMNPMTASPLQTGPAPSAPESAGAAKAEPPAPVAVTSPLTAVNPPPATTESTAPVTAESSRRASDPGITDPSTPSGRRATEAVTDPSITPVVLPTNPVPALPPVATPAPAAGALGPPSAAAAAPPGAAQPPPASVRIVLHAKADAWLLVRDHQGLVLLNRMLHTGETWPVPPGKQPMPLLLTTGNAGATEVLVDGELTAALGRDGAVRRNVPLDPDAMRDSGLARLPTGGAVTPRGRRGGAPIDHHP